jgi:exopolysaccharide production protein ExoY
MASKLQELPGSTVPPRRQGAAASIGAGSADVESVAAGGTSEGLFRGQSDEPMVIASETRWNSVTWSLPQPASQPGQRAVDLVLALVLLLLLLPIMALTALLVVASSPGPVIFRHTRLGQGGRSFECLKFRSMEHRAEELLPDLIDACPTARLEWEGKHKILRDPRVTPIGRLLRQFSIDELPQLWNVVRGEMSLVGPRPIVEAEIARYGHHYATYCSVRPGLTGLWQISGRNDTSYEQRVELDCAYARSKSIRGDLWIMLRTIPVVLYGGGY